MRPRGSRRRRRSAGPSARRPSHATRATPRATTSDATGRAPSVQCDEDGAVGGGNPARQCADTDRRTSPTGGRIDAHDGRVAAGDPDGPLAVSNGQRVPADVDRGDDLAEVRIDEDHRPVDRADTTRTAAEPD